MAMRLAMVLLLVMGVGACMPPGGLPVPTAAITAGPVSTLQSDATSVAATAQAEAFSPGVPGTASTATDPPPAATLVTPTVVPAATSVATAAESTAAPAPTEPPPASGKAAPDTGSVQAQLQEEIFLAGAPSFAFTFACDHSLEGVELPSATWEQEDTMGVVCLYGFEEGEEVRYQIFDAEGEVVESGATLAAALDSPEPAVAVFLNVEAFIPGEWRVDAQSDSADLTDSFEVARPPGPLRAAVRLAPGELTTEAGRSLLDLQTGDDVLIRAINLPADTEVSVGVYFAPEQGTAQTRLTLHEEAALPTDEAGTLSARLELDPSYEAGFYCVVVAVAADYEPEFGAGEGGATECFSVSQP